MKNYKSLVALAASKKWTQKFGFFCGKVQEIFL